MNGMMQLFKEHRRPEGGGLPLVERVTPLVQAAQHVHSSSNRYYCARQILTAMMLDRADRPDADTPAEAEADLRFASGLVRVDDNENGRLEEGEKQSLYALVAFLETCLLLWPHRDLLCGFRDVGHHEIYVGETALQVYMRTDAAYTARAENVPSALAAWMVALPESQENHEMTANTDSVPARAIRSSLRFPFSSLPNPNRSARSSIVSGTKDVYAANAVLETMLSPSALRVFAESSYWNVVCGGAASAALSKGGIAPGDVDVVCANSDGSPKYKEAALADLFDSVLPKLVRALYDDEASEAGEEEEVEEDDNHNGRGGDVYRIKDDRMAAIVISSGGVVTLETVMYPRRFVRGRRIDARPARVRSKDKKFQFLMRPYESLLRVLTSFDLAPTKVAYNTREGTFYVMASALYCMRHGLCLPNPINATSVKRALKYHKKGFPFAVPLLRRNDGGSKYHAVQMHVEGLDPARYAEVLDAGGLRAVLLLAALLRLTPRDIKELRTGAEQYMYDDLGACGPMFVGMPSWCQYMADKGLIWCRWQGKRFDSMNCRFHSKCLDIMPRDSVRNIRDSVARDPRAMLGDPCVRMASAADATGRASWYLVNRGDEQDADADGPDLI